MARPWRIQFAEAIYHITSRGNNQQTIFLDNNDRSKFLELIGRACARFELEIFAFCLMDNHYHLFLRTPKGNLSQAMHWLNGTYTGYFNWRHGRSGHLLQGRYRSVLVLDDAHWLYLSMYLHLNPVRAGMIDDPGQYFWSSFIDYIRLTPRFHWLKRDDLLARYGSKKATQSKNYRKECLALIGIRPSFIEQLKSGIALGSAEAIAKLMKKFRPAGKIEDVPDYKKFTRKKIDPEKELRKVAALFGGKLEDLKCKNKPRIVRQMAYYHLVENCRLSVTETAKLMGVTLASVSIGINRFQQKLPANKEFQIKIKKLAE